MKPPLLIFGFLMSILFSLSGCKKVGRNDIDATIYVKEYKTGIPIANARVVITRGRPGSGGGSSEVETLTTDSEGKVDYNTSNADGDYMYYAEAYRDKYFDTHNNQVSLTRGRENFETTIFMYAESYVKLHVKNVNPFNQLDLFELGSYCINNFYIQGYLIDTTFLFCDYDFKFRGNFNYGYSYTTTKNDVSINTIFFFTPLPYDTLTLNLNY